MAKLPTAESFGARPTPQPAGGVVSYNPTNDGEMMEARGQARLAATISEVAQEVERAQLQDDTLRAEDAFNSLREKQIEYTIGEDGFTRKKGGEAANYPVMEDYGKRFDQSVKEINEGLGNDRQRELFSQRAKVAGLQLKQDILNHVTREKDVYAETTYQATLNVELTNATERFRDPSGIALSVSRIDSAIKNEAERRGWSDEVVKAIRSEQISNLHTGVTQRHIAEGDTATAAAYLKANKGELLIDDRMRLENMLESKRNEVSSELRVTIADRMQDIEAMGTRGIVPPKGFITDTEIDIAYSNNAERAKQIKRRRDEGYRFASTAANLHQQGNDVLISAVRSPDPAPTTENFAEQTRHNDMIRQMAATILKHRVESPIEYAAQQKIGIVNDIDFSNPESVAIEIVNRQKTAKMMNDRFGSQYKLLTDTEAESLARGLKGSNAAQKRQLFSTVSTALGNDFNSYSAVMRQISPDDPVTAIAGVYAARKRNQAADLMLKGQDILRPSSKEDGTPDKGKLWPMPSDNDLSKAFADYERDAFAGHPKARSDMYQAAKAIYAAKSAEAGDSSGELDSDRLEESIALATGGIEKWNGKSVLMPYGYDRSQFKDHLYQYIDVIMYSKDKQVADGVTIDKLKEMPLEAIGEGKYIFRTGDGALVKKDGTPLIIDFNQPLPKTPPLWDRIGDPDFKMPVYQ